MEDIPAGLTTVVKMRFGRQWRCVVVFVVLMVLDRNCQREVTQVMMVNKWVMQ